MAIRYDAPASFTGEDAVEMITHGGAVVSATVVAAMVARGARLARPGEFTRRAVLNGKLDILQAEATGDLVDADSRAAQAVALRQLDGGLTRRVASLRDELIGLEALIAYDIDFPEEDDGPIAPARILQQTDAVAASLEQLLATARTGELVREGALVVLAGAPNVGKVVAVQRAARRESRDRHRDPGHDTRRHRSRDRHSDTAAAARRHGGASRRPRSGRANRRRGERLVRRARGGRARVWRRRGVDAPDRRDARGKDRGAGRRGAHEERPRAAVGGGAEGRARVDGSVERGGGERRNRIGTRRAVVGGGAIGNRRRGPTPGRCADADPRAAPICRRPRPRRGARVSSGVAGRRASGAGRRGAPARSGDALEDLIGAVDVEDILDEVFRRFCVGK